MDKFYTVNTYNEFGEPEEAVVFQDIDSVIADYINEYDSTLLHYGKDYVVYEYIESMFDKMSGYPLDVEKVAALHYEWKLRDEQEETWHRQHIEYERWPQGNIHV